MKIIEKMARILAYYTEDGTMCEEAVDFPFTDNKEIFIKDAKKFLDIYLSSQTDGTTGILTQKAIVEVVSKLLDLDDYSMDEFRKVATLQKALCDIELEKARQEIADWLDEICPHQFTSAHRIHRYECYLCRTILRKGQSLKGKGETDER